MKRKAIVLLSGGLDSATVAAIAQNLDFDVHALSFDYGQRHKYELKCAAEIVKLLSIKHHLTVKCDLKIFGGSALTDEIDVPKNVPQNEIGKQIPVTYVPARNTVFLSLALAWAETIKCFDIFIGVNAIDFSGYPDCRPEFIESYEKMANIAMSITKDSPERLKIQTPLINMNKREIIKAGLALGVDYGKTVTCYDYSETEGSCGVCEACILRQNGFKEAGAQDPVKYRAANTICIITGAQAEK